MTGSSFHSGRAAGACLWRVVFTVLVPAFLFLAVVCAGELPSEEWITAEGFTMEAVFLRLADEEAILRRDDGREVNIRLENLAPESRERALQRAGADDDGRGLRFWTAAGGASVRAVFDRLEGEDLYLLRGDGTPVKIGLSGLLAADQELARKLAAEAAPKTAAVPIETGPDKLPVFTSGPWRGYHAVFRDPRFDALMDADGAISLQLKEDGKAVGPPLQLQQSCYFNIAGTGRSPGRPVKEFQDPPAPAMQPREVILTGLLRDDVPFEVTFEFEAGKVAGSGWARDPREIEFATVYRILLRLPRAPYTIPPQMPLEERIELLRDYELRLQEVAGGRTTRETYTYYDAVRLGRFVREGVIVAPMWAPRVVTVRAPHARAPLRPYLYGGNALWQGYLFQMIKQDQNARGKTQRIEVIIE